MTAKPLDWKSWWEARLKMAEVYDGWSSWKLANRAMAHALRSGKINYRGEACDDYRRPVSLQNVIPTLRELTVYPNEAVAEYETSEVYFTTFGLEPLRTLHPATSVRTATARILHPEVVLPEFLDHLIQFELPAGVMPINARLRPGPTPGALRRYEAADRALFPEIRRLTRNGMSTFAAALKLARGAIKGKKVGGHGSEESRAKRLAALYRQEEQTGSLVRKPETYRNSPNRSSK